jgi:ABC-type transport system substrate-binding protein
VPTQVVAPQVGGYSEGETWYAYDPERARAILAEEGADDLEIELTFWEAGNAGDVAQAIAEQLAQVGITANVVGDSAYEDYIGSLVNGEIGALDYIAWYAGTDATEWYFLFARDAGLEFGEGFPEIWDALDAAAALPSLADRQPIYDQIARLIKEHVPMVPVAHEANVAAYRADVTGINPNDTLAGAPQSHEKAGDRDTFHLMLATGPFSAYCGDEFDVGSFMICKQVGEGLTALDPETLEVAPAIAEEWGSNADLTEWTFTLRDDVSFHNGATLEADDVLTTYAVIWDAAHPLHVGRTGGFDNWMTNFGALLNAPQE